MRITFVLATVFWALTSDAKVVDDPNKFVLDWAKMVKNWDINKDKKIDITEAEKKYAKICNKFVTKGI